MDSDHNSNSPHESIPFNGSPPRVTFAAQPYGTDTSYNESPCETRNVDSVNGTDPSYFSTADITEPLSRPDDDFESSGGSHMSTEINEPDGLRHIKKCEEQKPELEETEKSDERKYSNESHEFEHQLEYDENLKSVMKKEGEDQDQSQEAALNQSSELHVAGENEQDEVDVAPDETIENGEHLSKVIKTEAGAPKRTSIKRARPYSSDVDLGLFPRGKIRTLIKLVVPFEKVSNEALHMIGKASEFFLEKFAKDSFQVATDEGRRMIRYHDLNTVRVSNPKLIFLEKIIPPPGGGMYIEKKDVNESDL